MLNRARPALSDDLCRRDLGRRAPKSNFRCMPSDAGPAHHWSAREVWRKGSARADMQLDVERGASLAVSESHSLRTVAWRPRIPDACAQGCTLDRFPGCPLVVMRLAILLEALGQRSVRGYRNPGQRYSMSFAVEFVRHEGQILGIRRQHVGCGSVAKIEVSDVGGNDGLRCGNSFASFVVGRVKANRSGIADEAPFSCEPSERASRIADLPISGSIGDAIGCGPCRRGSRSRPTAVWKPLARIIRPSVTPLHQGPG